MPACSDLVVSTRRAARRLAIVGAIVPWALISASCGGGPEVVETDESDATVGGETASVDTAPEPLEDPCADGDEGCEDEGATGSEDASTESGDEDPTEGDEGDEGGEEAEVDPRVAWRQSVGRGRSVFRQSCDTCHPGGDEDIGPTLKRIRWSVGRMHRQIRQGSGRMRPIPPSRLPERYMDDLMAYMSTFGAVRGVQRPR